MKYGLGNLKSEICSAAQPTGSAGQPASSIGSAGQPAIRSIADVDKLLKADASLVRRFEESKRIEEVVACLRSNPKRDAIEMFFKPWDVQQRIKKDRRPLPELIEELTTKVIKAAVKAQVAASSDQSSAGQPVPMTVEQPGTSSVTSPANSSRASASSSAE